MKILILLTFLFTVITAFMYQSLPEIIETIEVVYIAVTAIISFISGWFGKKKKDKQELTNIAEIIRKQDTLIGALLTSDERKSMVEKLTKEVNKDAQKTKVQEPKLQKTS